jgi:predicted MFS family arabinose efflux permease
VALSLSASSLYAGQALAGVLGGVLVKHGPISVGIAASACVLVALAVHLFGSAREIAPARDIPPTGPDPAQSATPPVRSSV